MFENNEWLRLMEFLAGRAGSFELRQPSLEGNAFTAEPNLAALGWSTGLRFLGSGNLKYNCRWDTLKCGQMRGNAGSHDLQLGIQTLKALCSLTSSGMPPYPSDSICLLCSFGLHLVLPSVIFNPTTAIEMNTSLFLKRINTYLLTVHLAEADYYIMCLAGMTAKLPHYDKVGYLCLHWQPVHLTILDKLYFSVTPRRGDQEPNQWGCELIDNVDTWMS